MFQLGKKKKKKKVAMKSQEQAGVGMLLGTATLERVKKQSASYQVVMWPNRRKVRQVRHKNSPR